MLDALLAKFYKYIIVALLIFIFGYVLYANHLAGKLAIAEQVKTKAIADAIQPYQTALNKAKEDKATVEKQWSDKLIEVERNAVKQIQAAHTDAVNATAAVNRLSAQLNEANERLSNTTRETCINYAITANDIFKNCTARYRDLAEKSDGHVIDVRRLSDSFPEITKPSN